MGSDILGIAISGLKVSQSQLSTVGNNITHANDEGYSRQRVETGTNPALPTGAGFLGTGVNIQSIDRLANEFLTSQIRLDTSAYNQFDTFNEKITQLDSLLANESVGLSSGISKFFSALQAATDDPTSVPVRQLVLAEGEVLAQRFNSLYGRLNGVNDTMNQELGAISTQISALATSVASLNDSIANAIGQGGGSAPNDLLDERDETLRQLSELVSTTVVDQGDGRVNVFIGNGQPLVVGTTVNEVQAVAGQTDASRFDIVFVSGGATQVITDKLSGGQLGGLLSFRETVLDRSFNELGRIALNVTDAINQQQQLGLDLNGNFGVPVFSDVNERQAQLDRISPSALNTQPPDRLVSVEITDPSVLTNSDYELRLSGSGPDAYELIRLSDNTVVMGGGLPAQRPTSFEAEGFRVNFEAGSFSDGDLFRISPTRFGANSVDMVATSPEVLAFAQPVSTSTSLSNTGTGAISLGETVQTIDPVTGQLLPAFANAGELTPPVMIRFTSPTTYEVLDITDPANPVDLNPPLQNQPYTSGLINTVFPAEPGQTTVPSDGFNAGRIPRLAEVVTGPVGTEANNTYLDELVSITRTDPVTGLSTVQPAVQINAGDSADLIAFQLSSREGVEATAFTEVQLNVLDDGVNGVAGVDDFNLRLNGEDLRASLAIALNPNPVPTQLTNDLIAQAINANGALQSQGISAVSDGSMIRVTSTKGVDLKFQLQGDATDAIELKGDEPASALGTLNVSGGIVLANENFTVDIFDGPGGLSNPRVIPVDGSFTNSTDLVNYLQNQIDLAYGVDGKISVGLNNDGTLRFDTTDISTSAQIQVSALSVPNLLGMDAAVSQGIIQPTDMLQFAGTAVAGQVNSSTISGVVSVTLSEDYSLTSNSAGLGNVFTPQPTSYDFFTGYTFDITGDPAAGDEFYVNYNTDGVSDNRNALKFVELESAKTINDKVSFQESYGDLIEYVGTITSETKINAAAADEILGQSRALRSSISGVNLDEEAADLIRFEQAYNASSQVIRVARDLFDTLLGAF